MRSDGEVVARVEVGCRVRGVAVGAGAVWFTTDAGSVVRVDPATNRVVTSIAIGTRAGAIAAGTRDVWVADADAHQLVRIDATSNAITARIPLGSDQAPVVGLDIGEGAVWAIEDFSLRVVRIDPETNALTGDVPLCTAGECRVGSAAVGAGRVWVVDCCTGEVLEIDPESLAVSRNATLDEGVWELAGDIDQAWALQADTGRLVRLAPNRSTPVRTITTGTRGARHPQLAAGSLWFYASGGSEIARVPSGSSAIAGRIEVTGLRSFAVSR
jgi:streptogramin lyase